jgi:hypothetical protein
LPFSQGVALIFAHKSVGLTRWAPLDAGSLRARGVLAGTQALSVSRDEVVGR